MAARGRLVVPKYPPTELRMRAMIGNAKYPDLDVLAHGNDAAGGIEKNRRPRPRYQALALVNAGGEPRASIADWKR